MKKGASQRSARLLVSPVASPAAVEIIEGLAHVTPEGVCLRRSDRLPEMIVRIELEPLLTAAAGPKQVIARPVRRNERLPIVARVSTFTIGAFRARYT